MTVILDQFVQTLRECGLMTAEEIDSFVAGLPAEEKPQTGEDLAKLLNRYKKLTRFQIQAVYQGKTKGLVFGNYIVLDKIGQGGMGYVYKAQHRRMKRMVALKVLPSAVAKSPAAIKRFEREVEAAAKLSHPHIVTAYDADEADGIHFLVMEYVEGTDLANLVRRDGPLPVSRAIDYVLQAAQGLEFAHRHQVIHRDIKPSNLVLDGAGVVKILDMGLARFEREVEAATRSESLTESGQVMGTLDYMAPEQAQDTHRADARADIYSLGCTLFHLLMGRPVFGGDTLTQKILAHRDEPAPSLSSLRDSIPLELDAMFHRMVAKRPEDRYPSMSEVIVELEACRKRESQAVTDTASFHAGPTGGGDTAIHAADEFPDLTVREGTAGEHWLDAPLPLPPTLIRHAARSRRAWERKWLIPGVIAIGITFIALLFGIVLKFRTSAGMLVVEVNQPDAMVEVDEGKFTITTPDSEGAVEIEVDEGTHTLRVTKGGFETFTKEFTISSRGKETVRVELQALTENLAAKPPAPPVVASASPAKEPFALPPPSHSPAMAPPNPAASTPAVVASTASNSHSHRRAAEAVLTLGGTVTVTTASTAQVAVAALQDLPAEAFALVSVSLSGRSNVRDADLKELAGTYYLETLDLTGTSITDASLKLLGGVDVARIYVSDTAVTDEAAKSLSGRQDLFDLRIGNSGASPLRITDAACAYLTQLPRLRNLALAGTEVGDRGLVEISSLRSLWQIQVGENCSVKGLASLLALPNLQYLLLSKNSTGDELVEVLPQFPQLRLANLWHAECPDALALRLQKVLPNATVYHPAVAASEPERQSLRWLLDNKAVASGYTSTNWGAIYHDVPQSSFSVQSVSLAENGPTSGAVNLRGLRAVNNLSWANLKTADAEVEHFATLSSLRNLWLGGSDLTDKGIERLTSLRQLEFLGLRGCQLVTDRRLEHLTKFEHLDNLDIAGLPLSNAGLAHVGRIDGLQHLCLASCVNLTSEGLQHLTRLPILRRLNLTFTPIDDGAIKYLQQMACLRILWLNGTKVSASGIEELRRALPKCVIFWDGDVVTVPLTPLSGDSALPAIAQPTLPPPSIPPLISPPVKSPLLGSEGKWQLPSDAPPPAIAPFDAQQAKGHQEVWAQYLGVPMETSNSVGMKFVLIPPGEFLMGSSAEEQAQFLADAKAVKHPKAILIPSEGPQHRVRITQPFLLSSHEVTRGQFRRFVEETGYKTEAEQDGKGGYTIMEGKVVQDPRIVWSGDLGFPQTDNYPVMHVTWNDAMAFCQWLSNRQGVRHNLPTEAQWEYACRAGTTTFWYCGNSETTLQEFASFAENPRNKRHEVGEWQPNAWGLYDMHGSVIEWCADWYAADYYAQSPQNDPGGPTEGSPRSCRGGQVGWYAWGCRSAFRDQLLPDFSWENLGFRVAAVLPSK